MTEAMSEAHQAQQTTAAIHAEAINTLHHATAIYTAAPVVEQLLMRIDWPNKRRRLADPSAGDGAFVVAALDKALREQPLDDENLCAILVGWEVHPEACRQARTRVATALVSFGRKPAQALRVATRIIRNRDFLTEGPTTPAYDVIAGNPPYLRWVNVPTFLRDLYKQHLPAYAMGDMLHGFLDRCVSALRPQGDIAFVTSDRWLFNAGAAKLRSEIGRAVSISHLERLDVASTFYRPKQRRAGTPPRIHPVAVHLRRGPGQALTREAIYPGVVPGCYDAYEKLGDIASVRLAPWLGTAGIFVLSAEDAMAARIPPNFLVPAIDTDDVVDGELRPAKRFAIRTSPDEEPCAEVMEHLKRNMHRMAVRGRKTTPWLPPESFHRLNLTGPSLLVPRIAKAPRAITIPSGHLPINHNLSIVCADDKTLARVQWALSRPLAAQWVREHAAPLENGYYSLTTTLLRQLPIELTSAKLDCQSEEVDQACMAYAEPEHHYA
jgi:hypothetical protein